jgi:hypothetical protein
MYLTRKHISRRTVLKGVGATIALPLLDAMNPAAMAFAATPAGAPPKRIAFVGFPHGAIMDKWSPGQTGADFEMSPILEPLKAYRQHMTIVSGLRNKPGETPEPHAYIESTWLSCVKPWEHGVAGPDSGVTADQIAAQAIGQDSILPSMELATEDHSGLIGSCDRDYGCIYMNTLSWRTPTTPMPMEINPRKVFERMFGQGDSEAARLVRRQEDRSILDAVAMQATGLQTKPGAHDRQTLDNYLEGVREIERRLTRAESQVAANADIVIPEAPSGVPFEYTEHVRLMYDLLALAYRADITRVFTFMMGREVSNRTYTQVGVTEGHHAVSHHQNKAEKLEMLARIQAFHIGLFGEFLAKLDEIPDGDGSLLDNSILLYGSNMSNSNAHDHYPLPNVLVGGGRGRLKGGQHIVAEDHTPMTNLLLTMLDKVDAGVESLGDSTGTISELHA